MTYCWNESEICFPLFIKLIDMALVLFQYSAFKKFSRHLYGLILEMFNKLFKSKIVQVLFGIALRFVSPKLSHIFSPVLYFSYFSEWKC